MINKLKILPLLFILLGCGERVASESEIYTLALSEFSIWVQNNPNENEQVEGSEIIKIERTDNGWHVIFEKVRFKGMPEGESHHFLHMYFEENGDLMRIVRGPDEVS